jgi:hypothetical protein
MFGPALLVSLALAAATAAQQTAAPTPATPPLNGQVAPSATEIAVPLHYSLALVPDLDKKLFTGEESIQIRLSAATSSISLNAAEISFDNVRIVSGGGSQPARVEADNDKQIATFSVKGSVGLGQVTVKVNYHAAIRDRCCGLYAVQAGNLRYGVVLSDERRVFLSL